MRFSFNDLRETLGSDAFVKALKISVVVFGMRLGRSSIVRVGDPNVSRVKQPSAFRMVSASVASKFS